MPTAKEYEKFGHGKPIPGHKRVNKFVPNLVVYEDISEGGVFSIVPNDGVVNIVGPYDDPALARVRLRTYPSAAARSAMQTVTDGVVMWGVGVRTPSSTPPLNVSTHTGWAQGLSDVMLDHIESYVKRSSKPWQTRDFFPGLFRLMPKYDPATLTVALMSMIRGVRLSAEVVLEESAAQPSIIYMGRDVMLLEDRVVHLLRQSGSEPVV